MNDTNHETLIVKSLEEGILTLTINRPKQLNALNSSVIAELSNEIDSAEKDANVKVIVLTGSGDKAFVAGADIVEFAEFSPQEAKKLASLGYREDVSGIRGHEFHYSLRESEIDFESCFQCSRGDKGIHYKNLRASYIHWYFSSAPGVLASWLNRDVACNVSIAE